MRGALASIETRRKRARFGMRKARAGPLLALGLFFLGSVAQAQIRVTLCITSTECGVGPNGYQCDVVVSCHDEWWLISADPNSPLHWIPPILRVPECTGLTYELGRDCAPQVCYRYQCFECCDQLYPCEPAFPFQYLGCSPDAVQAGLLAYEDWAAHELCDNNCYQVPVR